MYCPLCGFKLEQLPKKKFDYIEDWWDLPKEEQEEYLHKLDVYESNSREEYKCTRKPYPCFGDDYPLYFHHPFGGIDSRPGDSWSLSWVK